MENQILSAVSRVEDNTNELLSKTSDYNIQQKLKNKTFGTITYPLGSTRTTLGFKNPMGNDPSGLISREFFEQNGNPTSAVFASNPELTLQYLPTQFDKGFSGDKDKIYIITFNSDATKAILVDGLSKNTSKEEYINNPIGFTPPLFNFNVTVSNGVISLLSNNPNNSTRGGPLDYPHFLCVSIGSNTNWKHPFTGGDLLWGDLGSAFTKDFKLEFNYDESSGQLKIINSLINFVDKDANPSISRSSVTLQFNGTSYEIYPTINPDIEFGADGVSEFVTDFSALGAFSKFQIKDDFDNIYETAKSRITSPQDLPIPYPAATNGNYTQAYGTSS